MKTAFFLVVAQLFQSSAVWAANSENPCDAKDPTRGHVPAPKQAVTNVTITSGGIDRIFSLYMPPKSGTPLPAVIHWHGFNAHYPVLDYNAEVTKVFDQAQKSNFIVIMPLGTKNAIPVIPDELAPFIPCDPLGLKGRHGWNVPRLPGGKDGVDDQLFAEDLLQYVKDKMSDRVDLSRVYTAGFSNGGFQAYGVGCNKGSSMSIAGVGANAGSMAKEILDSCRKGHPVPVQSFHSKADNTVTFDGRDLFWASQDQVDDMWRTRNGCSGKADEGPKITFDSATTKCRRWMCPGAPVETCTVEGLDHCWIGGRSGGYTKANGYTTASCEPRSGDIDATAHMFEFWDSLAQQASSNTTHIVV